MTLALASRGWLSYGQGSLFSRPMTPQRLTTLLEEGTCLSLQ